MKRVGKPVFFVVAILIVAFLVTSLFGIHTTYGDRTDVYIKGGSDIRWGIDIRGGVEVTFTPPEDVDATETQMRAAEAVIEQRLITLNITDSEVYTDYNRDRIIVRFPWKEDEADFDPQAAIAELGETSRLTFREGNETDAEGNPSGVTAENIILEGSDVEEASAYYDPSTQTYGVSLTLSESGTEAFAEATTRLAESSGVISIWMDNTMISYPNVNDPITNGQASITGNFTAETAQQLADRINSGALPFALETANYSTIDPSLGTGALEVMILAGIVAFVLVGAFMIFMYRLPGVVAVIALMGQLALSVAAVSGYFPFVSSFTLTLPGVAGIILAIGMGVDANVITAERIREEVRSGKSIDGSIELGYQRAFAAILDGNMTVVIVAIILMGAFGPPSSIFARILNPLFFLFGSTLAGTVYSFGYTLLVGVIGNFIFGILSTKLMLKSISRFKAFRKLKLYGGER
ncbi:MAG TPA: SecD/SecF family protein translocase subunit [Candidatus Merdivicinus intestinavium]|nr:SecD/SecF family protein translocase subunit [Candidatus Merdivicinus intestinavium]